jgi:DNA-binding GntR family transcriptional regulator
MPCSEESAATRLGTSRERGRGGFGKTSIDRMRFLHHVYMMQKLGTITLRRARDEAKALLREGILCGQLAPGAPLEEVQIAARLGVSRTPVREALIALEEEGLVSSRPRKGYVVAQADAELVRQTYPILAALEAEAVRLGGVNLRAQIERLRSTNKALSKASDKAHQHALDRALHSRLVGSCQNERLLRLIEIEWARARWFDGAQKRGTADQEGSCAEHQSIIEALERADYLGAAELLHAHWHRGIGVVTNWLKTR